MDDKIYYDNLQSLVDKAKELKSKIVKSSDDETIHYLRLALNSVYDDMKELMKRKSVNHGV